MNTPALAAEETGASSGAGMPLRLAQRAFAALIENPPMRDPRSPAEFRAAQLRSAARRTLSALSADDNTALVRWLGLQLATLDQHTAGALRVPLNRVDVVLSAAVATAVEQLRGDLALRGAGAAAA